MATPQLSPGVLTREVDLTVGRAENVLDNIGAIAGPFSKGPVEEPVNISTEKQLLEVFGRPSDQGNQYEYWMSASSYLSYGGVLKVVRVDDTSLINSNAAVGEESTVVNIKNFNEYSLEYADDDSQNFYFASKNPGSWGNNLKVCLIDDAADQRIVFGSNILDFGVQVGYGLTAQLNNIQIPKNGVTEAFTGYLKAIITGIQTSSSGSAVDVKIISRVSSDQVETPITYSESNIFTSFNLDSQFNFVANTGEVIGLTEPEGGILQFSFDIESASTIADQADEIYANVFANGGSGENASFTITRNTNGEISSIVGVNRGLGYAETDEIEIPGSLIGGGGNITEITFSGTSVGGSGEFIGVTGTTDGSGRGAVFTVERNADGGIESVEILNSGYNYAINDNIIIKGSAVGGVDDDDDIVIEVISTEDNDKITLIVDAVTVALTLVPTSVSDWYNEQTLNLTNSTIFWRSIAEKPRTNDYSLQRNSLNDALHIVVVDDSGSVTGIQGNILEKHLNLSKARDSVSANNSPAKIWYKEYLAIFSNYIFAGANPSVSEDLFHNTKPAATGFSSNFVPIQIDDGLWGLNTQGITFSSLGNKTYNLSGGSDYSSGNASLSAISNGYDLFSNKDEIEVDYLICGPSINNIELSVQEQRLQSQAKADKLITIANERKDCIAVISPYRSDIVNFTNSEVQTNDIIRFFGPLSSSSYAVFDSGYKYTYDRFNNKFRYVPCNADVAGLMARTSVLSFPWFSPAGQQRGILNNAIKLAYNPNKDQRDRLYSSRVNSIVNQPGIGILLFGDKTALGYASAFDRINVRRLFLTVQQALQAAADAQLFELNDDITRSNFVNIVDPFLRDIQAKRGVFDFRVICDESNNTPDVIDNNEFRADIFLKPARSINYVTLTFVATRTGVSFEEVVGNV
jgi:hypothetical protein